MRQAGYLVLDNGQVAEFEDGEVKSTAEHLALSDTLIDGRRTGM